LAKRLKAGQGAFGIPHLEEAYTRFEIGPKIILAVIVRDFWVVEERKKVFATSLLTKKVSS
jgi:hypothetical protein